MTTKELHDYVNRACEHCAKVEEEHLSVMVPDAVEKRCLDANVLHNQQRRLFKPKEKKNG